MSGLGRILLAAFLDKATLSNFEKLLGRCNNKFSLDFNPSIHISIVCIGKALELLAHTKITQLRFPSDQTAIILLAIKNHQLLPSLVKN